VLLSIDQKEPADALLARFADLNVAVRKASQLDSGEIGSLLHIDWFNWISSTEAKVTGGVHFFVCGGICPDVGIYRVVKRDGGWRVLEYEIQGG
jgi:hypothetical protein